MHILIDATQKETAIDQQQQSCEMLICCHQTIPRLLSTAATASTRWRVHELIVRPRTSHHYFLLYVGKSIPPGHQGICIRLHSVPHKWQQLNLPSVEGPTTFDNAAAPINTVKIYEQLYKRWFKNSAFSFVSQM